MKYQHFIFKDYKFDPGSKQLRLHYSLDDQLNFEEVYGFEFDFADYDEATLERAIQTLFFLAGVSYYKTFVPPEIIVEQGQLDESAAAFYSQTYQKGLGEFWYVNQLDPNTPVIFPSNVDQLQPVAHRGEAMLVGIGGGKDSLVTTELLRDQDIATWSLNHRSQLEPLVEKLGTKHYFVSRQWDPQLKTLNEQGAYNGHVPISAILAAVGTIVAILTGRRDVVVSNEQSANEDSLVYKGLPINHQYSKSQVFERDYQTFLGHNFGETTRYYSFLRPLSEVMIAEIFAHLGFEKYKSLFSSCNRAYVLESNHMSWCGVCPKCAFTFLILTPFVKRADLESIWQGKNLLLDPSLSPIYRQLLGIESEKPLDCVGEVKESRSAMRLAQKIYPELQQVYTFDIPADYDYRTLGGHEMPSEIYDLFNKAIQPFAEQPE